jgi:CubicO group peptidase (beta-lactamase class C family)
MTQADQATVAQAMALFTGEPQYHNFSRMQQLLPTVAMQQSSAPYALPEGPRMRLPTTYTFEGSSRNLHALLGGTHTAALLVLKDGVVRYEDYWFTGGRDVQWLSMSVAKSFVSALVGIALAEGSIASLEEPITRYVPKLLGSAYDGVRIKDVLQMSSGARWNEDYNDPSSEIFRLSEAMGGRGSFDDFMAGMVRQRPPGTFCLYNSADTQALGMLVAGATGSSLADYMQTRLCEPLGMEATGYWIVDGLGREMAYAGLLLTARDFARIGELYRNGGLWQGRRVVPADYVAASITADAPHLQPGAPWVGDHVFGPGYGYQWWLPAGEQGDFSAIGVYNQYVYVDPARGTVIVKLSANPAYGTSTSETTNRDNENIEALRAISRQLG